MGWNTMFLPQYWFVFNKMIQSSEPLKQIIRYQQQLKSTSQRIEIIILDNNPNQLNVLKQLISEEEMLIKYLEVETSRLNPHSKKVYMTNLTRFKRKSKQHKDYIITTYGRSGLPSQTKQQAYMDYQKQNAHLMENKMMMYENQRVQDNMGNELHYQGDRLYGGIERNREMRRGIDEAQGSIDLIKLAILKRKIMFSSLIVLFVLSLIIALIVKANRK